jgi:hypothetical protein
MSRVFALFFGLVLFPPAAIAAQAPSTNPSSRVLFDSIKDDALRQALAVPGATLEYRWAVERPTSHDSSSLDVYDAGSRTWFRLDQKVWLTLQDLRTIGASFSSGRASVFVSPKPEVERRLQPSIAAHKRQFLAVIVNGHFVDAPFITASIARMLPVVIGADSAMATNLVERLRAQIARSGK